MAVNRGKINKEELNLLKQKNKLLDEAIAKEKKGGLAAVEAGKKRRKLLDDSINRVYKKVSEAKKIGKIKPKKKPKNPNRIKPKKKPKKP